MRCFVRERIYVTDLWFLSRALAGEVLFADVLLLPNGMSKVGANT